MTAPVPPAPAQVAHRCPACGAPTVPLTAIPQTAGLPAAFRAHCRVCPACRGAAVVPKAAAESVRPVPTPTGIPPVPAPPAYDPAGLRVEHSAPAGGFVWLYQSGGRRYTCAGSFPTPADARRDADAFLARVFATTGIPPAPTAPA